MKSILRKSRYCLFLTLLAFVAGLVGPYPADAFRELSTFGNFGENEGELKNPYGLAVDEVNGFIYVADTANHRVQVFSIYGDYISFFGSSGTVNGQFRHPQGVGVDASGNVYVVGTVNSRIQKFLCSGGNCTYDMQFGTKGSGNEQFFLPRDISIDSADNIYVCDSGNDRILKFDPSGNWQATIGAGDIFNPYGIDVDDSGNIYVADTENHRIVKYDPNGTILMQFGSYGTGDGEFRHPHDVAVDGEGNIFVADTNNYRIKRFNPLGEYVYSIGRFVEYITPQKVVVDNSQRLYTIDSNTNRIRIYDVRDFITNVYAEPTTFSPDGDGIHDVTNIHYTIPEPALITIAIYDANNTLVRTLLSDAERVTPNNVEVWDGVKDDFTYAEEGYYTCRLDARASGNYHPPQQRVDLRVHYPLGQISGSVTDGSDPLEGATVTAETHSVLTDPFGDYTITDLPTYEYNVVASKAGCSEVARLVILDEDEVVTGIDFELGCYQVSGVVTDGTDPLEGVLVTNGNQSAFTDSAGQYVLENLLAGTYTLTAEKAGCIVAYQLIYVDRNQPIANADFTLDCTPQPDIRVYPESLSFTVIDSAGSVESLPLSGSQSSGDYEIELMSRKFTPEEKTIDLKLKGKKEKKFHAIVQFYRVPDKWEKKELKKLGLKMLSYLKSNAWFSSIHTTDLDAIINHPLVRWIGELKPEDKISPRIVESGFPVWSIQEDGRVEVVVKFFDNVDTTDIDKLMAKFEGDIEERYYLTNAIRVILTQEAVQLLTEEDIVQWIEESPPPFQSFNDGSRASVIVDDVQVIPYNLSGLGIVVGIWDEGHVDADHDDFYGRVIFGDSADIHPHTTHVAGTLGGDGGLSFDRGGSIYQWRGMAPDVQIISYDWNGSTGEHIGAINMYDISISLNPWGYDIDEAMYDNCSFYGDYDTFVAEYDAIARGGNGKPIVIVAAVGNDRDDLDCGFVSPVMGYGTIPPIATGKNLLAVGAVNSDTDSMTVFSAWGPVDDGRIKPELVAPGCEEGGEGFIKSTLPGDQYGAPGYCGTSMAAPVVSGVAALIMERFKDNYGSEALPSTVKAYMIHTAVDLETPGPDYQTGYGKVNALAAIDAVDSFKFVEEQLEHSGQEDTFLITVPEGAPELKLTLVWDDLPGVPNSPVELINDLDLVVTDPDGIIHAPWILDPGNPSFAAGTGEDHLNTIEQVYVLNPIPGTWSVKIQGTFLAEPQSYSLVTENIGTDKEGILTVYNDGTLDLNISEISKTQDWLSVDPTDPLTISVNGSKVLNVSVSTIGLASGSYTDNIKIVSDDPDEGIVLVPVNFTYDDTLAPIVSEVRSSVDGDTDNEYPVDSLVRIEVVEQNGEEELTGTITITGVDDPGIAGEPLTEEGGGVYFYLWDTQGRLDGDYYVEVTLMDASGNEDSDGLLTTPDLTITLIDVIPPVVSITSPGDGVCINNSTVTVEGTVFDAISGVASVVVNGELASIDGGNFTAILTGLPDEPLTITATAKDNAGNDSSFSINVDISTLPPNISIIYPVDGVDVIIGDVTVTGTADTEITTITVTSDQGHSKSSAVDTEGNWSVILSAVNIPSIVITAQGTDGCGNIGSDSVTVPVYIPPIWYVNDNPPTDVRDGQSWETAFDIVQDAVVAALNGDWIWVAEGVYTSGSTTAVLTMKAGVEVYGGFTGTESNLSERGNPADHPTILDGEDMSYNVVIGASNARLDGFVLTGGSANCNSEINSCYGGGMYNDGVTNVIVANCTFSGNSASEGCGGAMCNNGSSLEIINTTFSNNFAFRGGGICNFNISSPTIRKCTFSGNSAVEFGGGILNWWGSSPTISKCTFSGNWVDFFFGGGMYNAGSSPTIIDSFFIDNYSPSDGAGMFNRSNSSPEINNCTFNGNWADGGGGGMWNDESSPKITNSTFSENFAGGGAGIGNHESSPEITNCIFINNQAGSGGGIHNQRSSSPKITNSTFSGNSAGYWGGGIFNYRYSSSTITNCIMSGDISPVGSEIALYGINYPSTLSISYSDVQGGWASIYVDPGHTLNWGVGIINDFPLFVSGPNGDYYLSQTNAGQLFDSPCIDAGSDTAANLNLDDKTTATNGDLDIGWVDMGFHYNPLDITPPGDLAALPSGKPYCPTLVALMCNDPEATIYYTLDGSGPTTGSLVYTGPINITEDTTLKFVAVDAYGNQSGIVTEIYDIYTETPTGLVASPAGGSYCAT
ncbi:MAG: S8 family serine peptidase, partial [Deltaproteobacteria bacterium]